MNVVKRKGVTHIKLRANKLLADADWMMSV